MITTIKKPSEVKKAKSKAESNRELMLMLLEWTDLQYGEFVMQCAENYLKMQCGSDTYGINLLLENKLFWAWWRNQWSQRDDHFLVFWADCDCILDVRNEYEFLHSANNLHMRPHRVVMEKSYMKTVQDIINHELYAK